MVHVPLMFLSEWREFPSALCLAGKKKLDSSRLDVVEIACVAWHAFFQPLYEAIRKKLAIRHMNRPLFPTTLSIRSYDIGKEVGLSTYPHPHVGNKVNSSLQVLRIQSFMKMHQYFQNKASRLENRFSCWQWSFITLSTEPLWCSTVPVLLSRWHVCEHRYRIWSDGGLKIICGLKYGYWWAGR